MKKNVIRLLSLFLVCLLLCVNVPVVRAENINLGVDIQNGIDEITVTIDNSDDTNVVLEEEKPTLVIDCPFSPAYVKHGDTVVESTLSDGKIRFRIAAGGTYKVLKGTPPAVPDDPADPTYTVTYQSNGGSSVASASNLSSGSKLTKPTDPTRSGYTFTGWYKNEACTDEWDFDTDTVTGNITLYAGWEEIVPVVTGITVTPASAEVKQGGTQQFTATITGTNLTGVTATWTVTGATDTATTIDSTGKLTVGSKETADLVVVATAGGKTGTATVDVKKIYTIKVGNWTKGSGKDLTVTVKAPADELLDVLIDGKVLSTNSYTSYGTTETTIKLKNSYLETRASGTYSIEVEYEDGYAEDTFKIKKQTVSADTGDIFNLAMWIGLMALSLAAAVALIVLRIKKKW